ncbi:MAG TPA: glycosyltransferase [Nocardioidaceae bacterium]|nr:glycosyltransferase [Nocardioidaceae bacterium]
MTEAFGSGVATAIEQYMGQPAAEHHLLARLRPDIDPSELHRAGNRTYVHGRGELIQRWLWERRGEYDLIHAHSSWAGLLARTLRPVAAPLIYSPHAPATMHGRPSIRMAANVVERLLSPGTRCFAAVSTAEAAALMRLAGPRTVIVVPHHVEFHHQVAPRDRREEVVVAAGRLSHQKNPESVAALPSARMFPKSSRFVWIGDGDSRRRHLLEAHGWEVTGWLSRSQTVDLVARAAVLLHPARYEGMPFVILEALAAGTPVIAARASYLEGLPIAASFDRPAYDLPAALRDLLADETRWHQASRKGIDFVEHRYTREAQGEALSRIYRLAIKG